MEELNSTYRFLPPVHTNIFAIPNERRLLSSYSVYTPSIETRRLKSEQGRTIYAETFIEHSRLGPLSDLCVRALAKSYGAYDMIALINSDPLKVRIHYDSLSVDLPLEQCYFITDPQYWRRVVLEKSHDKTLAFKESFNWRNSGISLKFVELVEACPAMYWSEEHMINLGLKVKDYVTDMHIRQLQSLPLDAFDKHYESDLVESTEGESETSSKSSELSTPSSTKRHSREYIEEEEEELILELQEVKEQKAQRDALKDAKRRRREAKELRHKKRDVKESRRNSPTPTVSTKSKPPQGVFDIPIEPDENNSDEGVLDRRNLQQLLENMKSYRYPPEVCHHIDLKFVRIFDQLISFTIEFQGPLQHRNYHRHFNFSNQDIENLAYGVSFLKGLKHFHLDARKLKIIAQSLQNLEQLENVDFGYNQLGEDCGESIYELFDKTTSIKSLELKGNMFSTNVLKKLADSLRKYEGTVKYLGLAGNPLGAEALHALMTAIIGTEHVKHLCLTGIFISQEGIICCIANELLRQHRTLRHLELMAIPFDWKTSVELIKALETNQSILHMDCRGCNLELEVEFEVQVILRRNRYLATNPYVGDETKTEQEVAEWVERIKNPILLKALDDVQKRSDCLANRPDDSRRFTGCEMEELNEKNEATSSLKESQSSDKSDSSSVALEPDTPFVYDPNQFNFEEFKRHLYLPGPEERFFYFQKKKRPRDDNDD